MLILTRRLASARCSIIAWWHTLTVVLALLGLTLVACQGGQTEQPASGEETTTPETVGETTTPETAPPSKTTGGSVNRITYVSPEGDLFTINPDGSDPRKLTGEIQQVRSTGRFLAQSIDFSNFYTWPTWSPDGTKLAASRIQVSDNEAHLSIQVIDVATGRGRTIFNNDPSAIGTVTQTAPHYLYWSPDSKSLAFVAPTPQGLTMFVEDTETPVGPTAVQQGAPIYFHWAGDGNSILFHIREDVKLARKPFDAASPELLANAVGFRVPALSPDGRLMAYTPATDTGGSLFIAETAQPSAPLATLEVGALSAFMWSPDGAELAVLDQDDANAPTFQRLRVVSSDGGDARTIAEERLIAFFWSPNGEQIAWVSLDSAEGGFNWNVAPRSGTPARQIFRFEPTRETFEMLFWFDQFGYSHSPWSPDSSQLVIAGTREPTSSQRNGQTPTGAQVFVLDAAGDAVPREIASGTLAFWSWN